ncbi:MAG TPA: hypothetical protein VF335_09185 [Chitinivibrionales bacterium]
MNKVFSSMLACVGVSVCVMGKDIGGDARMLSVDYAGKQRCSYLAEYTSQGSFKQKENVSKKSTAIRCMLSMKRKEVKKLDIRVDSVSISSDMFDEKIRAKIRQTLVESPLSVSLARGYPSLDSATPAPGAGYLQWDLNRQLFKLLPALPEHPVKQGFTWERTITAPLQTQRGSVSCETYRCYTLKRLQNDTATVTWKFTFSASKKTEGSDALKEIPVSGAGNGTAVIDLRNRCIISATMDFTTPVASIGDLTVSWTERAEFILLDCK